MIRSGLKTRVVFSFLLIIALMSGLIALFGYWVIRKNVIVKEQKQVQNFLWTARSEYRHEIERMKCAFDMIEATKNPSKIKNILNLDYFIVVERQAFTTVKNPVVIAASSGNANGGTRLIDSAELVRMGQDLFERAAIPIKPTLKARPSTMTRLTSAMAIEYAAPIFDSTGAVVRVIYGGKIVNRYVGLIGRIHDIVFENKLYDAKPVGTVTIFQDDVRIATNVLDKEGRTALGTRVSSVVYDNVVTKGQPWYSRAFVVTDWYLTAYEPLRDVSGRIIGILYVGALEAPFRDMLRSTLMVFLIIVGGCTMLAFALTLFLAGSISSPLTRLVKATATLADGDLSHRVPNNESIREIHRLAVSFNEMADKLHGRDLSLRRVNEDLNALNTRYLDLVSIVSHELKGILSSTMLNAYSVRDRYLGPINETQYTALESITRNLEYFDMAVKNFLNLSRIEKDELSLTIAEVRLKEEIVDESVHAFSRQALERGMHIDNRVTPGITIMGDTYQLLMVVNNLLGNAIKYGAEKGEIVICARKYCLTLCLEVFNRGRPITAEEQLKLFKRFSRLDASPEGKRVRGTGLGLFLCRQIVERHGGTIACEARADGNAFIVVLPLLSALHLKEQQVMTSLLA